MMRDFLEYVTLALQISDAIKPESHQRYYLSDILLIDGHR